MTELVTRNYWWPGVTKEVGRYVDGCDACQRYKNRSEAPAGKLMPNVIPEKPWSHISADFITKLPLAQGYDAILVVCDRFSKMAHFIATTEKTSAEGLARLFQDHVWKLHGLPESIVSDRGVQFAACKGTTLVLLRLPGRVRISHVFIDPWTSAVPCTLPSGTGLYHRY